MSERTPYQDGIIKRYYNHRDQILLMRLSELVSELYLEEDERKSGRLWKRIEGALDSLQVPAEMSTRIVDARDLELLARQVKRWLAETSGGKRKQDR